MNRRRSLKEVVKQTALVLNKLGFEYAIVGGVAVSGWGATRTTTDVDVIIDLGKGDADRFASAFAESGFSVTTGDIHMALGEQGHFTIFDNHSTYHIDAKGVYGEAARETLGSRKPVVLDGIKCFLASPEDMIANKLLYGSEQDLRDAEGIYARQLASLDFDRLGTLCRKLGVLGELRKLEKRVKAFLSDEKNQHLRRFLDRTEGSD